MNNSLPLPLKIARLILRPFTLALLAVLTAPLWPLYWLGILIWYRPPNVPRAAQVWRYLRLTWTVKPPPPGLPFLSRCWLTLTILRKALLTPVWGLAWLLDEVLYGRTLADTPVEAPLFIVSAARSGSTQITLYLEEDPHLAAPAILQCMFPYLWLWHLVPRTIGRLVTKEQARTKIRAMMPPELLERHEGDPFKTDTFEGAFYGFHLNAMAFLLGPDVTVEEFGFGRFAPHNRQLWEEDFVTLVDRIGRKTLVYNGRSPDGLLRRFMLKGHFLAGANALARKYPDGRFLTIIREPASRLRSAINFIRVNPTDSMFGPIPWEWLTPAIERTETIYCREEMTWFTRQSDVKRCVIRFTDFVNDLEAALRQVYRCCFDAAPPPHLPKSHPPRERTQYTVNRSLAELGIDAAQLRANLADYVAWCEG